MKVNMLNGVPAVSNSTIQFDEPPHLYICAQQPNNGPNWTITPGFLPDPEGDTYTFLLTDAYQGYTGTTPLPVSYAGGFSVVNPLGATASVSVAPNGQITISGSPHPGIYTIGIDVTETRNSGIPLGYISTVHRDMTIEVGDCRNLPPTIDLYSYSSSLTKVAAFIFADCITGGDPIVNTTHCITVDVADPEGMPVSLAVDLNGAQLTNVVITPDGVVPDRFEICFTTPGQGGYEFFLDVADGNDCPTGTIRQPVQVHQYASLDITGFVTSPGNTTSPLAVVQGAPVTYTFQVVSPAVSLGNIPMLPYQGLQLSFPIPGNVTYGSTTLNPTSISPVQVVGGQILTTFNLTAPGGIQTVEIDAIANGCGYSQPCAALSGSNPMPVCHGNLPCPPLTVLPPGIAGAYVLTPGRQQLGTDSDPAFIAATNVFIAGEFEVDNSSNLSIGGSSLWTITGKNFWMDAGSLIHVRDQPVQGGALLGNVRFVDCAFQAVCGVMWQGIVVENKCSLQTTSANNAQAPASYVSRIQDAVHGIRANPGSFTAASRTEFRNNHIGILYRGITAAGVNPAMTQSVTGCTFTGGNLLPLYSLFVADPSVPAPLSVAAKSFAGVFAVNPSNGITIAGGDNTPLGYNGATGLNENRFYQLGVGIASSNTSLIVQNSLFSTLRPGGPAYTPAIQTNMAPWNTAGLAGTGIFHVGTIANSLNVTGFGDATVGFSGSAFTMPFGIRADSSHVQVTGVRMGTAPVFGAMNNAVSTGIYVTGTNKGQVIRINTNTLNASRRGVWLSRVSNKGSFTKVNSNFITVSSSSMNPTGLTGIQVDDQTGSSFGSPTMGGQTFYSEIFNNTISVRGQHGIWGTNMARMWVRNNNVQLQSAFYIPTFVQYGIRLEGSNNNIVTQNAVVRGALSGNATESYGLYYNRSQNCTTHCNSLHNTGTGAFFGDVCSAPNLFKGNRFFTHRRGLWNGVNGVHGNQYFMGNVWRDTTYTYPQTSALSQGTDNNITGAFRYSGIAAGSMSSPAMLGVPSVSYPMSYRPTAFSGPLISGPNPGLWFTPFAGTNYTCVALPMPNYAAFAGGDPPSETEMAVAAGTYQPEAYENTSTWSISRDLYNKIMADQTLLNISGLAAFADNMETTTVADFAEVDAYVRDAYGEYTDSVLLFLRETLLQQQDSVAALEAALAGADSVQRAALQNQQDQVEIALAQTTALMEVVQAQIAQAHRQKIETARLENGSIAVSELYELNLQTVNELNLALSVSNNPDSLLLANFAAIEYIATQCPLAGGPAVFDARVLRSRAIDGDYDYDDVSLCETTGTPLKQGLPQVAPVSLVCVPNPAQSETVLTLPAATVAGSMLKVHDLTGRLIDSRSLAENVTLFTYPLANLPAGVYVLQVRSGESTWTAKLVVTP